MKKLMFSLKHINNVQVLNKSEMKKIFGGQAEPPRCNEGSSCDPDNARCCYGKCGCVTIGEGGSRECSCPTK